MGQKDDLVDEGMETYPTKIEFLDIQVSIFCINVSLIDL